MRTLTELQTILHPYQTATFIYDPEVGHLSWHVSTGGNIEMLFIEAAQIGKGLGRELYRRFIRVLQETKTEPYHSVFAFRLASNDMARKFYTKMGWTQQALGQSIYRGEGTVVMWITWEDLLKNLGAKP